MSGPAAAPVAPAPAWVSRVPSYAGMAVLMLALLMLLAWTRHFAVLGNDLPALPVMKANAAVAAVFAAGSLIGRRPGRRWLAVVPLAIAGATLVEWMSGHALGIDQALVHDTFTVSDPGRPSPQMAGAMVCFSVARLLSGRRSTDRLGGIATAAYACVVLVLELGWLFHAPELASLDSGPGLSLPGAVCIGLLAIGLAGLHAQRRPLVYLWDSGPAGTVVRHLLPWVLVAPPALGLVPVLWQNLNLGVAMFAGSMMLLLAVVVTVTARSIHGVEIERTRIARELQAIFDCVPAVFTMRDAHGELLRFNRSDLVAPKAPQALDAETYRPPPWRDVESTMAHAAEVLERRQPVTRSYGPTDEGGEYEVTKFPVYDEDGSVLGVGGFALDVTAGRKAEREARRAAERLRAYLDSAPDATVIIDESGIVRYANNQVAQLLGYTPDELVGNPVDQLVPAAVRHRHADLRTSYIAHPGPRAMGSGLELTVDHRDGHSIPVEVSLSPVPSDEGMWVAAAIRDVTARRDAERALREAEQRARHLADHDPLTGIWNRRRFESELVAVLAEIGTLRTAAGALMIVDVDHFKAVNDTYGHAMGDRLLVTVAEQLAQLVETTGAVSRLGGDEFAVMICVGDQDEVDAIAGEVVTTVQAAGTACGLSASGSVGVALFADLEPTAHTTRAALVRADDALYAAKAAGRGRHVLYGPQVPRSA